MATVTETEATITYCTTESPLGPLMLSGRGDPNRLQGVHFAGHAHTPKVDRGWRQDDAAFAQAREQLAEYFDGGRRTFDMAIDLVGSPFERSVWEALLAIPYGATASYGDIAREIGRPGAARAVGAANGRNPISIIVPCHRVIGADASLTGYGWGVDRKAWLLALERGVRPLALPG